MAFDRTHRVDPVSVMVGLPHTWRAERRSRAEADDLLDAFDLGEVADQFVDELSTAEIAGVLGRSEGAVRVLIHRALKSLARDMGVSKRSGDRHGSES